MGLNQRPKREKWGKEGEGEIEREAINGPGTLNYLNWRSIDRLPKGSPRIERIQQQIKRADRKKDFNLQIYYRFLLSVEYCFRGDPRLIIAVANEVRALCEQYPSEIAEDDYTQVLCLNIVDEALANWENLPEYPLSEWTKWFEWFYQMTQQFQKGEQLYWSNSTRFWWPIDRTRALEALDRMWKVPRDDASDCEGCDFSKTIGLYLEMEEKEQADALLQQYLDQHNQQLDEDCDETPKRIYNAYLLYELQHQEREGWEKRAEELAQKLEDCLEDFEEDMDYYVTLLYDKTQRNLSQAVEEFSQYAEKIPLKRCYDFVGELRFYSVGAEIFHQMGQNLDRVPLKLSQDCWLYQPAGEYLCKKMEEKCLATAREMAECLDRRNGTDYYIQMMQQFYRG